jgi:hypothetical protein
MSLNESAVTPVVHNQLRNCTMQAVKQFLFGGQTTEDTVKSHLQPLRAVRVHDEGGHHRRPWLPRTGALVLWAWSRPLCVARANRKGLRTSSRSFLHIALQKHKNTRSSLIPSCMSSHTRNDVHLEGWSTSPGQGCLILTKVYSSNVSPQCDVRTCGMHALEYCMWMHNVLPTPCSAPLNTWALPTHTAGARVADCGHVARGDVDRACGRGQLAAQNRPGRRCESQSCGALSVHV